MPEAICRASVHCIGAILANDPIIRIHRPFSTLQATPYSEIDVTLVVSQSLVKRSEPGGF